MAKVYLGLGTNLGNKEENLRTAVRLISQRIGEVTSLSSFYKTAPWGFESENYFLNAAAEVITLHSPQEILEITQNIEKDMGRTQKSVGENYTDRPIDIDLLLYDNLVLHSPTLIIPHPLMIHREFVMKPLIEIAPDVRHPVLHQTLIQLFSHTAHPSEGHKND